MHQNAHLGAAPADEIILTAGEINELLAPALNICRAIELDVQQHPDCPYRDAARKGTDGILKLMARVQQRMVLHGP